MPVSFDWEFEEEAESSPSPETPSRQRPLRRRLARGLVLLILLFSIGLGLRAWITGRLDVVDETEDQLRTLVELELETIREGDREVFITRQDPADPLWQERQSERYFSEPSSFSPAPGLVPAAQAPEIAALHLFGRTARVELNRWFRDPEMTGNRLWRFHVTWFYRLDQDGTWYHARSPDGYWGVPFSWHGSRLEIRANEAEADVISPIATRLTTLVAQTCEWVGCPDDAQYILSFDDVPSPRLLENRWMVPAPYLAGMPATTPARTAWSQDIQEWTVEALANTLAGEDAPAERILYQQLVTRLKRALDLYPSGATLQPDEERLARAMRRGQTHSLPDLWEATANQDPEANQLLETEVAALLQLIQDWVGPYRLLELLPALSRYDGLSQALSALYGLEASTIGDAWSTYLSRFTQSPLPLPALRTERPGDQLALICDGRIWMGDADGTNLAPLTVAGLYFSNLRWSPDGRWLLTAWQPDATGLPGALYLLSSDGTEGRLLTNEESPPAQIWPVGWSPDGQQAIYLTWPPTSSSSSPEILSAHVQTREKQPLPGLPDWSPDGTQLVYATGPVPNLWLADAGWDKARPIADRATIMWQGESWSPDGSRVAFTHISDDTTPSAIALYDLVSERITPLITPSALTSALLSYQGDFISDGTALSRLKEDSLRWLWPWGWSADGRRLLVWAYTSTQGPSRDDQSVLAAITLQDVQVASVQVLAYGTGRLLGGATWSPTDPRRLALKWWRPESRFDSSSPPQESPSTFLVDLEDGVLFSAPSQSDATPVWSPGGDWLAFVAQQRVTVIDSAGKTSYSFAPPGEHACSTVEWNPAADLSRLGQMSDSSVPARKEPELIVSVGHVEDFPLGSITPLQLQATINDPQSRLNRLQTPVPGGPATVSPVPIFLVHDPEQGFLALYNRDTWLGCQMTWVAENQRFESPCHGQYYAKTGECVRGPCLRGLDRFAVVLTKGGEVLVDVGLFQTGPSQDSPTDQ